MPDVYLAVCIDMLHVGDVILCQVRLLFLQPSTLQNSASCRVHNRYQLLASRHDRALPPGQHAVLQQALLSSWGPVQVYRPGSSQHQEK